MATRPSGVAVRPCSSSSCMTTAVDDIARPRPRMIAALAGAPSSDSATPQTTAESRNCKLPMPATKRRSDHSRSTDISMPIRNSRNMTPSSANGSTRARSSMVR